MNADAVHKTPRAIVTCLAAGAVALALMLPMTASANHDEQDVVNVLLGAAVAYTLIDALDDDRDRWDRHDRRYRVHHGYHARHDRHWRELPGHHRKHAYRSKWDYRHRIDRHHDRHYRGCDHGAYGKGHYKGHYKGHKKHYR